MQTLLHAMCKNNEKSFSIPPWLSARTPLMHQSIKFDQSLPSSSLRRGGPSRPSPPTPSRSPAVRGACPSPSARSWAATSISRRTFSSGPDRTARPWCVTSPLLDGVGLHRRRPGYAQGRQGPRRVLREARRRAAVARHPHERAVAAGTCASPPLIPIHSTAPPVVRRLEALCGSAPLSRSDVGPAPAPTGAPPPGTIRA